ncbi:MAG: malate dehydrogenase [Sulfurimonas sp.]
MHGRKVGIIGAGAVGATAAYSLVMTGSCEEIILFDIAEGIAQGKAIDIGQAAHYSPKSTKVTAAETAADIKGCDIVVITAGVPRKGDMSRTDLLMINAKIMKSVLNELVESSPDAVIICVSNPLDVMTYVIHRITGWERNRIIGMAGALDGARMAYQIYRTLGYGMTQTGDLVIGDHGQHMIPLPQKVQVGSVNASELLTKEQMEQIIDRTKNGGAEIVKYLGTSGYYGPGRAVAYMVEAILDDAQIIVSSSVLLDGEYGYSNVTVGVPILLGRNGVEKIIEMELDEETEEKFRVSVDSIRGSIGILTENKFFE